MDDAWADRFRTLLAEITGRSAARHGYPVRTIEAAEARLGVRLPDPVRAYYLAVGRHPINQVHNRLLAPDGLELAQRRLVFMEENQCVVFWGVRCGGAADPVVQQTTDLDDDDWSPDAKCSLFLPAMLCWQAVSGGLEYIGTSDQIPVAEARRVTRGWRQVGRIHELSAFVRAGRVVCVQDEGEQASLYVGARSKRDFLAWKAEMGIGIDEL